MYPVTNCKYLYNPHHSCTYYVNIYAIQLQLQSSLIKHLSIYPLEIFSYFLATPSEILYFIDIVEKMNSEIHNPPEIPMDEVLH